MRCEKSWQNFICVIASYIFYGWWDYRFCSLILISSLLDFYAGANIFKSDSTKRKRLWLAVSLIGNLSMLGFFKYFNFFSESAISLLKAFGFHPNPVYINIILPAGISFYTFQTLSYTIDIYRGKQSPCSDFFAYMAFVSFFPQLVAGPIERSTDLTPQFRKARTFNPEYAQLGLALALWGFFKKMVIADNLAPIADHAFNAPDHYHGPVLSIAVIAATFQVYADFSAYSDIAAGTARLFGINLMRNFQYPFFSDNIRSFWKNWHISLNTWLRDYIYLPLGGGLCSKWKRSRNIFLTFCISGLWHGAGWVYVIFGALHGIFTSISHFLKEQRGKNDYLLPRPIRILCTFTIFALSFIVFRSRNIKESCIIYSKLFSELWNPRHFGEIASYFSMEGNDYKTMAILAIFLVIEWRNREKWEFLSLRNLTKPARWTIYTVLFWTILILGTKNHDAFVYFQF